MRPYFLILLSALSSCLSAISQGKPAKFTEEMKLDMQVKIKEATKHAWGGYKQYAWGYDDLRPLTKTGKNWYKSTVLMTPVDAYDTFVMLGLDKEAAEAKDLILSRLKIRSNNEVQIFEITIRILAGLITGYELSGEKKMLTMATELADRMMPAFKTPTGMPYRFINLETGRLRDSINNPAEVGTLMLEFGKLSKLTGNKKYYRVAKKAILTVFNKRSKLDLVGEQINVITGEWKGKESHISGYIDSYYEYLYKGWLLFGDKDFKTAFETHNKAIKKHLISKTPNGWFMHHVDMHTGVVLQTKYGALDAFFAGLCALEGDVETAKEIQKANYYMWTKFSMEPEEFNFANDSIISASYILRPENIESCFYLFRSTGMVEYLWMAKVMIEDILRHCKTETAFASIKNVSTLEKHNSLESFFFAETLKYAYLIFAPESAVDLSKVVFNTEAHPFKIEKKK